MLDKNHNFVSNIFVLTETSVLIETKKWCVLVPRGKERGGLGQNLWRDRRNNITRKRKVSFQETHFRNVIYVFVLYFYKSGFVVIDFNYLLLPALTLYLNLQIYTIIIELKKNTI